MHIYLLSKSVGCYKMKKQLPKCFHNVDLKTDKEYKKWKKAEDKIIDETFFTSFRSVTTPLALIF